MIGITFMILSSMPKVPQVWPSFSNKNEISTNWLILTVNGYNTFLVIWDLFTKIEIGILLLALFLDKWFQMSTARLRFHHTQIASLVRRRLIGVIGNIWLTWIFPLKSIVEKFYILSIVVAKCMHQIVPQNSLLKLSLLRRTTISV